MNDKTTPRNSDEEEILGYRNALNIIHESFEYISITPNFILQIHHELYKTISKTIGGKFKNVQNYISAKLPMVLWKELTEILKPSFVFPFAQLTS